MYVCLCVWRSNIELYITRNTEFSSAVSSGKGKIKHISALNQISMWCSPISHMIFFSNPKPYTHVCYAETSKSEEERWKKAREWDNNNDGNRVAVSTIDRNQKISSGQFNSNLNPIKDLVTNPQQHIQQQHQRAHFRAHIWLRQTKNSPAFQHIMLTFSTRLCLSVSFSSSVSHSLFAQFRVIILLQGIKIRQRSSNVMDFWELDSFVCLKNTSDCVYASVNIVKAKIITTNQRRENEKEAKFPFYNLFLPI